MSAPLEDLLADVPPVRHAFAYGSAVFNQPGLYAKKGPQPMADYFLVVDDGAKWHDENIALNPQHYGGLSYLGGSCVQYNARSVGANVHFNTLVTWRDRVIKYGVMERRDALQDLCEWDQLYVAGRLHKPVLTLAADAAVVRAQRINLRSAAAAALLLLPAAFHTPQLHRALCGISYRGDVRMAMAEDSRKVARIADGSAAHLSDMYSPAHLTRDFAHVGLTADADGAWARDASRTSTLSLLAALPSAVLTAAVRRLGVSHPHWLREQQPLTDCAHGSSSGPAPAAPSSSHPLAAHAAPAEGAADMSLGGECISGLPAGVRTEMAECLYGAKERHMALVAAALGSLVARSSRWQAVAGLLANGPRKSCFYVGRKVIKSVSGWMAP